MIQHRRYRNPPIEEALCEFRFKPGSPWNLTIPGKLQTALGEKYLGNPQERRAIQVGMDFQGGKPPNLQYDEGVAKVQLMSVDGTRMVGVGPDTLSIHMLRPYQNTPDLQESGWNEFEPRISEALNAYWSVAKPVGVGRVGLRYINKIVTPETTVRVEDYLKCALPVVAGLPDHLTNFICRIEYSYDDNQKLILSQGLVNHHLEHIAFLLDLDVIWNGDVPIAKDTALEKASELRALEREAFETVITDKARELFDAA